ncbi:SRPBCC domain-containing protein [Acidocella sp. KAb 2-4]|uniref:SRPBCC domain-containing protein n=1 Tax=Acidocella sp. KAb 2-4 TaxID=2885158 RepID=UPI001D06C4E8|nr:SRPBCC domain-containing protein [Acidocella sp. KAb 2-4]MCB5945197.1 SRPBCC domain-containing protein [Acidocella sp. KAb 2-4]
MLEWSKIHPTVVQDPREGFDPDAVTVSDVIEIAAPVEVVWKVLIDLERYGEWNPFCVRAASTLELGAPVQMSLVNYCVPGSLIPNCEYVCAYEPERRLSWRLPYAESWPYPARRDQVLESTSPESCRYISSDAFLGVNGIHVFRFAGPWIKRAFDDTAKALKAYSEALYQSRSGSP